MNLADKTNQQEKKTKNKTKNIFPRIGSSIYWRLIHKMAIPSDADSDANYRSKTSSSPLRPYHFNVAQSNKDPCLDSVTHQLVAGNFAATFRNSKFYNRSFWFQLKRTSTNGLSSSSLSSLLPASQFATCLTVIIIVLLSLAELFLVGVDCSSHQSSPALDPPPHSSRLNIDHSTFILRQNIDSNKSITRPEESSSSSSTSFSNGTNNNRLGTSNLKFELSDHHKPKLMELDFERFNRRKTPSTFRPTSPVLYLHPPKPRHISSIHCELLDIDLKQNRLLIEWQVVVILRNDTKTKSMSKVNQKRQSNKFESKIRVKKSTNEKPDQTPIVARVESELDPLKWIVHLRKYGTTDRRQFSIVDYNNTLDGPRTENKTYRYEIPDPSIVISSTTRPSSKSIDDNDDVELLFEKPQFQIEPGFPYEFCLQSLNGGQMKESESFKKKFPITAHTELPGQRRNPLYICKEILIKSDSNYLENGKSGRQQNSINEDTEVKKDRIGGRSLSDFGLGRGVNSNDDVDDLIKLNQNSTDEFVMYTAISSGSTTVFLLIVVALFCCCKCRQNRIKSTTHQQLTRNTTSQFNGHDSIRYNRAAVSAGAGSASGTVDDRFPFSYSPYYQSQQHR